MKSTIKKALLAMIVATCAVCNSFAQFGITPATGGAFGRTISGIAGVGVGFFPNGTPTGAAFHINTNLTAATTFFTPGEVFRTDAPSGQATGWRLLHGGAERDLVNGEFLAYILFG